MEDNISVILEAIRQDIDNLINLINEFSSHVSDGLIWGGENNEDIKN